jgi:hypothetical protein
MSGIEMGGEQSTGVPLVGGVDGKLEAGTAEVPVREIYGRVGEPTLASAWYAASGARITDRLLEWPPDVFALTNALLSRAEAFRYALSFRDWPPSPFGDRAQSVDEAGRGWSA